MKIGFDGKRAVRNSTGLGNYSRLVISTLAKYRPDSEYIVYSPSDDVHKRITEAPNVKLELPDRNFYRHYGSLWRTGVGGGLTKQAERDGVILFHGLSNELPLNMAKSDIPSVVTVHDLIYLRRPEMYKPIDRKIYNYKYGRSARNATRVIAISECTRRDLIELQGVSPDKIDVIYQGCDPIFRRDVSAEEIAGVKSRIKLTKPYIIGVGTIERRKNQLLTLRALAGLNKDLSDVELVLVGRQTGYADEIRREADRLGLSDRLRFISGADFKDFPALYAGALVSSYPSRYEGYGLPVVESLAVGTPVVVASGSCLEEAGGPATPVVNPDDAEELACRLESLIKDDEVREKTIKAGKAHAWAYDDKRFADEIFKTYEKALGEQS